MPGRPRVLALGGCTILELMNRLSDHVGFRHFWRHNVVCDMGGDIDVSGFDLDDPQVLRLFDKHARKLHRTLIAAGDFDWLVMECAADLMFGYLQVGDAVLPDVRNSLFAPGWENISFDRTPALRDAALLFSLQPAYWEMWKDGFTRLYAESLGGHLAAGKKIFFIQRFLCGHYLSPEGIVAFQHEEAVECNRILKDIYAFLDGFPGLTFIQPPEALHVASAHAPWGGPWEAHPEREYYDYVGEAMLRVSIGPQAAEDFRVKAMIGSAQERVEQIFRADANAQQVEARDAHLVERNAKLADQSAEIGALTTVLHTVNSNLENCRVMLRHVSTERDRFATRVALMQKRYAPVRSLYKAMRIGRINRWVKGRKN